MRMWIVAVFALTLATVPVVAQCAPQSALQWLPGSAVSGVHTTGAYSRNWIYTATEVTAATIWDSDGAGPAPPQLVVGGWFDRAGRVGVEKIAAWDGVTWSGLDLPGLDTPRALAGDSNGRLCVAVDTHQGSEGVRLWNGASWTTLGNTFSGKVHDVAILPNGEIVAGGYFTDFEGVPTGLVARWDGSGWSQLGGGLAGPWYHTVNDLIVLPNGDLVAAGQFVTAGGSPVSNIARWDGQTWHAMGGGLPAVVDAVAAVPGGDVFAALGTRIWRWNGTNWSVLPGSVAGRYFAIVGLPNGDLIAAGGADHSRPLLTTIERWDGSAWTGIATSFGGHAKVAAIRHLEVLPTGELVAMGRFASIDGVGVANVASWSGTTWSAVTGGTNQAVHALHVAPDGRLLAGGAFTTIEGTDASLVATWDGNSWAPLGSGVNPGHDEDNGVYAFATLPNGDLVAAGSFLEAGGVRANLMARWDGARWAPFGIGVNWAVWALHGLPNGNLLVGGGFDQAGGTAVNHLAQWDGSNWSQLGAGLGFLPYGGVRAIAELPDGDVVVAGYFRYAAGLLAVNVARWDGANWHPMGNGLQEGSVSSGVNDLLVTGTGELVAGGDLHPVVYGHVARWTGNDWLPLGGGTDGPVSALLELPNGDLLAGGRFQTAGGVPAANIARWDGSTWSAVGSGTNEEVRALAALPNGDVAIGGRFTVAGGEPAAFFTRLSTLCPALVAPLATTCAGSIGPVALAPEVLPWVGSTFTSKAIGFAPSAFGVALVGLTSPDVSLSWLSPLALPGCNQLASHDAIQLTLPQNGRSGFALVIPNDVAFAGLPLFHQFLQFEVDAANQISALSSSNGLRLTIGAF